MSLAIGLANKKSIMITPTPPFNFEGTIYNPGHFPTPTEKYEDGIFWQTMRFLNEEFGLKFENEGATNNPEVKLTIYSKNKLTKEKLKIITGELNYRFEFNRDISEFCEKFKNDKLLELVLRRWKGMRIKCGYSLYESLIIYIILQNATVRRTVQMSNNLFENFGTKVKFDNKEFHVFWKSDQLNKVSEDKLRELKLGYRAKSIKKVSESFSKNEFNEIELRKLSNEELKKELIQIYGIGPASVWYLLFEVFHRYDALDYISPWEQKIYSKISVRLC